MLMFRKGVFYLSSFLIIFINTGLDERPSDAYNWSDFGLLQCTLISILLYLSHLLQDKTLYLPQILGRIYTWADSAHPDQEQSGNGLCCLTFDLHSESLTCTCMHWWIMLITFSDNYVNFWYPNIYEHAFYLTIYLTVTCYLVLSAWS